MNKYLKIFSCCHVVRGAKRAAVYDSQRKQIYFLPLSLCELIDERLDAVDIDNYRSLLDGESLTVFEEYLAYMLNHEIGFLCSEHELEQFPKMSTEYFSPSYINNVIIDCNKGDIDFINDDFLTQLKRLCCNYIQFRFFAKTSIEELQRILDILNPTQIKAVEIILPRINDWSEDSMLNFLQENRKVRNMIVTSAPESRIVKMEDFLDGALIFSDKEIASNLHCGIVQLEQFAINVSHYTESLNYNTCLNGKIAIDSDGNIKNCPSMKESFGNIKDTTLEEAINRSGFKKHWTITKDEITKCKECEFRHVCTDCRAYLENPDDPYSAPLKCGYDPYSCRWEEWSMNPLKEKAIDYYGMNKIINFQ